MEHLTPQTPPIHQNAAKKGLRRQVLHPVRNPADAFSHLPEIGKGKTARTDTLYPPCPVPVPIKIKKSCLVPYCQAAGLPYCSPPAREYPSRLRLHKRHDTDSRWRQVTKLPRPCPQYPPFTLRYGNNWFSFTGGSWRSRRCHAPVTGPPGCRSCL